MRSGYSIPTLVVGAGAVLATAAVGMLLALQAANEPVIVPVPEQAGVRIDTVRDSFNKR